MRCKKAVLKASRNETRVVKCCPNYAKKYYLATYREKPRWKSDIQEPFGFCNDHMGMKDVDRWNVNLDSYYRSVYHLGGDVASVVEITEEEAKQRTFSSEKTYLKNRFMNIMSQKNVSKIKYEEWEEILMEALNELQIKRVMTD
jgi:hypothetical protein